MQACPHVSNGRQPRRHRSHLGSPVVTTEQAPGRGGGAPTAVLAAAAVSGVAGYVVLVVVARYLTPATNAEFLVFWERCSGCSASSSASPPRRPVPCTRRREHPSARAPECCLRWSCLAMCLAVVLGASGLVWAPRVLGPEWPGLLAALLVGSLLFASHCFVAGAAAGRGDWTTYSLFVGSEAVSRLVLVGAVVLAGGLVGGLAWAVALACGAWLLVRCCRVPGPRGR